ncbi:MAG: PrpF domain-containing protein [Pseudomonadota bacterium]
MARKTVKAAFYRGGTSKAVMFNAAHLPADKDRRDRMFLQIMGSPDAYGRQLDGMGGGISSLSKIVIVEPSARADADIDYTFVQIAVGAPVADYGQMCGNMSSAVGPFAIEEGLVRVADGPAVVRVHNTNTGKLFHASFDVRDGRAVEAGDFEIPGVSQRGAKVRLEFFDPGGSRTGVLLPTGQVVEDLDVPGLGVFRVSMVDASNPVVFVNAADLGRRGDEHPAELDADRDLMDTLEAIRRQGAVAMGLVNAPENAQLSAPKVALVAAPTAFSALDGRTYDPSDYHVSVRLVSMGNFHRAITLTGAMCVAVAARIPGTLIADHVPAKGDVLIGNPSGVLPVEADVRDGPDGLVAHSATTFRTQRRIMEGFVSYLETLDPAA